MSDTLRDLLDARLGKFFEHFSMAFAGGRGDANLLRRIFSGPQLFLEATVDRRDGRLSINLGRPVDGKVPPTPFMITEAGSRATSVPVAAIDLMLTGDRSRVAELEILPDESSTSLETAIDRQAALLEQHIDELVDGNQPLVDQGLAFLERRAASMGKPTSSP